MQALRFLHIPKTAGTSLTLFLRRLYPGRHFRFSGRLEADREAYRSAARRPPPCPPPLVGEGWGGGQQEPFVLVHGHAPRKTGIAGIDDMPTITFLREPVRRVMSYCQHVREGKSAELLERFPPESFALDAFLDCETVQLRNLQLRFLIGRGDLSKNALSLPGGLSDVQLIREAIRVLSRELAAFGITEQFDESLLLLRRALGWTWESYLPLAQNYEVANRRDPSKRLRFTPVQVERIRRMNALDLRLYAAAVRVFKWRQSVFHRLAQRCRVPCRKIRASLPRVLGSRVASSASR